MSKKNVLFASLILALGALTGCGGGEPYDPDADPHGGGDIKRKDFEYALNYDYQSFVIDYVQEYAGGAFIEQAREYHRGGEYGITVVDDITYDESIGSVSYSFYASTSEDDYAYWPSDNYYVYSGWVANGYRDADLAMYHAYFSFYYLLDNITVDDVELIAGMFYVKPEAMDRLNATAFQFYGNPLMGGEDLTTVAFYLNDETGLFYKIYGSISEGSDDGFEMIFSNINSATYPVSVPQAPYRNSDTDRNIYTYAEMLGDEYVPDVWPTSVSLSICETVDTETGFDMVIDLDQSVDIAYLLEPDNVNRKEYRWVISDQTVIDLDYKANYTAGHKYLTGVKEGTSEVYIEFLKEDGTYARSNTLKVKVRGVKTIDKTNAVYDLTVLGGDYRDTGAIDPETSEPIRDKDYTDVILNNASSLVPEAPYQVEGHNIHFLEAQYTESFGKNGMVIYSSPSSQDYMSSDVGFDSYLLFDFGDQEVISLDFYYSLQRSNQKGAALDALSEAYIVTSVDGTNWSDSIDMKAEMKGEFDKMNLNYEANLKLMSRTFEKARLVKLYFKANMVGKNFNICMNSFVFKHDSTCHDHEPGGTVIDVESITIASTDNSVKVHKTLSFSVSSILPINATDKSVSWHVSDTQYASIDDNGVLTAIKEGSVKVYALSSNNVKSNEIEVTVTGQEFLPERWVGYRYLANDVVSNLKFYDFDLNIVSTSSATLKISPSGETPVVINFTYDTYDNTHTCPYVFVGPSNEVMHVKLSTYDDSTCEVFLSGSIIALGNSHTNIGEEFTKYVASTGIVAKTGGNPLSSSFEMFEGKSMSVVTVVNPSTAFAKVCTATSSNPAVATIVNDEIDDDPIDNVFTLSALSAGTTTLTFSNGEVSATYSLTVKESIKVTSLSLSASKSTIEVDEALQLNVTINPNNANDYNLVYSMNNSTYATLNSATGVLTGKKVGSVTVTVTDTVSGKFATFDVTIVEATYIIPPALVGTWAGEDLAGTPFTFTINSDGSANLVVSELDIDLAFTFDSDKSSGSTFYFNCSSGDITICIWGSGDEKSIDATGTDEVLIDGLYLIDYPTYVTKE